MKSLYLLTMQCLHYKSLTQLKKENCFPPLNESNSFGTVDYDPLISTNIEYFINNISKTMVIQELHNLHHFCELERTQLLFIFARSVPNSRSAN